MPGLGSVLWVFSVLRAIIPGERLRETLYYRAVCGSDLFYLETEVPSPTQQPQPVDLSWLHLSPNFLHICFQLSAGDGMVLPRITPSFSETFFTRYFLRVLTFSREP